MLRIMGRTKTAGFAVVILGVSIASLLVPLPNLNRSIWLTKLFDLGHVPLFAVVTICLWRIDGRKVWLAWRFLQRRRKQRDNRRFA